MRWVIVAITMVGFLAGSVEGKTKPTGGRTIKKISKSRKVKNSEFEQWKKKCEKWQKERDSKRAMRRRASKSGPFGADLAKVFLPEEQPLTTEGDRTKPITEKPKLTLAETLKIIEKQKVEIAVLKARVAELEAERPAEVKAVKRCQVKDRLDDLYSQYAAVNAEYHQARQAPPESEAFRRLGILKARRSELIKAIKEAGSREVTLSAFGG